MRPTFDHTVSVLVKAYLNNTLEHGNCCACAVGNIIADVWGYKFIKSPTSCSELHWDGDQKPRWYSGFKGTVYESYQTISTGYSVEELQRIEIAFEFAPYEEDRMLNGLMAVVDVLAEIHNVDLQTTENARKLFVKA